MKLLTIKYQELLKAPDLQEVNLSYLVHCLKEADTLFGRIFACKSLFEELLNNIGDVRYKALIRLLKHLIDENADYTRYTKHINTWEFSTRKLTFNPGRLKIKRYLAIIANKKLRMEIFEC